MVIPKSECDNVMEAFGPLPKIKLRTLMIDFHIITVIGKIVGHTRSLRSFRSLQSLCFDIRMIAGIADLAIAAVAALVFPLNRCDR